MRHTRHMRESDEDRATTRNSISADSRGPTVQTGSARDIYFGAPSRGVTWRGMILALVAAVAVVAAAGTYVYVNSGSGPERPPNPAPDGIRWEGAVTLNGVNLDLPKPKVLSDGSNRSVWASDDGEAPGAVLHGNGERTLSEWNGPGEPNRKQCGDQLAGHGKAALKLTDSTRACVRTAGNRIAYLDDVSFDARNGIYTAAARVWASTLD